MDADADAHFKAAEDGRETTKCAKTKLHVFSNLTRNEQLTRAAQATASEHTTLCAGRRIPLEGVKVASQSPIV